MWEVYQNQRVVFGEGCLAKAPEILRGIGHGPVLVLAYSLDAPCVRRAVSALEAEGLAYVADASLTGEPETGDIDRIAAKAIQAGCDRVLALGGGSVLDAAKAVAMLAQNGGAAEDYQSGARKIERKALPLVAVPTTAGTGSEATKVAVLYNPATGLKKSIYSPGMIAEAVLLDPLLTVDLPAAQTVNTGADALSHAIESYVSLDATPYTEQFSLKSMALVRKSLERCVACPTDVGARGDLLLAAYFGGVALNAGIGLAHILAQPLGGLLKSPHGAACAIFLPHAMAYNQDHALSKLCDISRAFGLTGTDSPDLARAGIAAVKAFLARLNAPDSLRPYAGPDFDLEAAAGLVAGATGHIRCNPRPVTSEAIRQTIRAAL